MRHICLLISVCAVMAMSASDAAKAANGKLKVAVLLTLSGPSAVLGEQMRNGFQLALDNAGGKFGGLETEIIVADDEQKPDVAAAKAREFVERDGVDFVVGPVFSTVLQAIINPVTNAGAFLISPNAGPSTYAGADCRPNFFVTSNQNDQVPEAVGKYAQEKGYRRVFMIAPNYQAGKDVFAGFKNSFKNQIVDEVFTSLGQLDFSAELAQIGAAQPDAVFAFMPGAMGVNLVKQYSQAGLKTIPLLSVFTVDETTIPALQDAAVGNLGGATWAPDFDNPVSRAFEASYEAKYHSIPGSFAAAAYDGGQMINAAVTAVKGNLSDKEKLRAALKAADIKSPRGNFKIGNNHYPIQDFYLVKVGKRDDGKYETQVFEKMLQDNQDRYASSCKMK